MATEFKLPELGENIETGDLVRLMIKPGASIAEGEPVMELETDKAVVEVPSSVTGTVGEIRVKEGDKLRVGQVIFTVENGASNQAPAAKAEKSLRPRLLRCDASSLPNSSELRTDPAASFQQRQNPSRSTSRAPQPRLRPVNSNFPNSGENIDSGDLVRLLISPGTTVAEGQPVMELETDKAVVEVPSSVSGVVREIKVKEGQKVKVGEVIFTLEGGAAAAAETPAQARARSSTLPDSTAARLGFQLAMQAEGKTEEAGAASRINRKPLRRNFQHARATGESCRHGAPRPGAGGTACASAGARNRRRYSQRGGQRSGRAHQ